VIWSIATATGWTVDYILWKISWVNIQMMIADAPRYISGDETRRGKPIETGDDLVDFIL
jgi:hypothetical protein